MTYFVLIEWSVYQYYINHLTQSGRQEIDENMEKVIQSFLLAWLATKAVR